MNDGRNTGSVDVRDEKPKENPSNEAKTKAKSKQDFNPEAFKEAQANDEQKTSTADAPRKKKRFTRLHAWGQKKVGAFKRWQVTGAVCLVVFVAAGAGMLVWHESPSFCGAICHASMDGYLPTYEAEPGEASVDKWGNEVSDASSMMASVHRKYGDVTCLDCHKPTIAEQATEGINFVTGGYTAPLYERNLDNLTAYEDYDDNTEFCLNESCHNMTKSDLTKATSNLKRNPHSWHHFQYTCTDCHKSHRASVLVCTSCHDDSMQDLPDGWLSHQESKELDTMYGAMSDAE